MNWIFQGYILPLCLGFSVAQVQYDSGGYVRCSPGTCTNGRCQWSYSGYGCVCNHGYQTYQDIHGICVDKNECDVRPSVCPDGVCINYMGTYECRCNRGFKQSSNKKQCLYDPNIPFTNTWGFQEFLTSMGYNEPQKFLAPTLQSNAVSLPSASHYSPHQSVYIIPRVPTTTPRPFPGAASAGRRQPQSWLAPTDLQRPTFLTTNNVLPARKSTSFQSETVPSRAAYYPLTKSHTDRYPITTKGSPPKFSMNMLQYNTQNAFQDQSQTPSQTQYTSRNGQSQYNAQPQTWATPNAMLKSSQPYAAQPYSKSVHNLDVPTRDPKDPVGGQHPSALAQHQETGPMTGSQQHGRSNTLSNVLQQHQRTRQYWTPQMLDQIPASTEYDRQHQYTGHQTQTAPQYYSQYQSTDNSYSSPHYPSGAYGREPNQYNTMGYPGQYNPYDAYQPATNPVTTYSASGNKQYTLHDTSGSDQGVQHIQTAPIDSNNSPHSTTTAAVTNTPIPASTPPSPTSPPTPPLSPASPTSPPPPPPSPPLSQASPTSSSPPSPPLSPASPTSPPPPPSPPLSQASPTSYSPPSPPLSPASPTSPPAPPSPPLSPASPTSPPPPPSPPLSPASPTSPPPPPSSPLSQASPTSPPPPPSPPLSPASPTSPPPPPSPPLSPASPTSPPPPPPSPPLSQASPTSPPPLPSSPLSPASPTSPPPPPSTPLSQASPTSPPLTPSPANQNPPTTTHPPTPTSSSQPPHTSTNSPNSTSTSSPSPTTTTTVATSPPNVADVHSTTTVASSLSNNTTPPPETSPASSITLPSTTDTTSHYAAVTPATTIGAGDTGQNVQITLDVDLASFPEVSTHTEPLSPSANQDTKQNQNESTLVVTTVLSAEATPITETTSTPTTTVSPTPYMPMVNDALLIDILNKKHIIEGGTPSPNQYPMYPSAPTTSHTYHPTSGTSNRVYKVPPAKPHSVDQYLQTYDNRISPRYYSKSQQTKHTYRAEENVRDIQPLQKQTMPANMQAYYQTRPQVYPKYQSRYGSRQNTPYNYNVPSYYYNPKSMYNSQALSPPAGSAWFNLPQSMYVRPSNSIQAYLRAPYRQSRDFYTGWNRHPSSRANQGRFMARNPSPSDDIMLAFVLSNVFK